MAVPKTAPDETPVGVTKAFPLTTMGSWLIV
jgi:hypothetical protein